MGLKANFGMKHNRTALGQCVFKNPVMVPVPWPVHMHSGTTNCRASYLWR